MKAIVEKCDEALDNVSGRAVSPEDIHTARKGLKKARAWLRLLRTGTDRDAYREQNHALRDAARPLSEGRDAQVLIETLHELLERYHEPARDRRFGRFERALRKDRRGRKSLRTVHDDPSPESLHEWRKDTKNLWHQLQMLEPLWPGVIEEWADQAHQLADYLGDDHDLWVLREASKAKSGEFADAADLDALLALIDRRRSQLQDKARLLGARLYEPKPRRLRARIGKYWRLWGQAGRPDA